MKINIKTLIIIFILIMSVVGCSKNENEQIIEKDDSGNNNSTEQETPGRYSEQGRIVKIDENGLHVQKGEKVDVYNVDKARSSSFYIGEYVGLNKLDGDKYDAVLDEYYDYNKRYTSTGESIKRVSGTVGEVSENYISAVTEMGDVKFINPGEFNLKAGDQFMADYVEMAGGNQMLSYYDEAHKINVTVKEIARDISGVMRIYGLADDNKEYDVKVEADTITNFSHSTLKAEDKILVYSEKISGDIPAVVEAKLIIRNQEWLTLYCFYNIIKLLK